MSVFAAAACPTPSALADATLPPLFPAVRHYGPHHLRALLPDELGHGSSWVGTGALVSTAIEAGTPAAFVTEHGTIAAYQQAALWQLARQSIQQLYEYEPSEMRIITIDTTTPSSMCIEPPGGLGWRLAGSGFALLVEHHPSIPIMIAEPLSRAARGSAEPRSRAFRAFTELRGWLNLSVPETATLVGIGRTTANAWERVGHEPRPRRARRLYELHALAATLVRRLGVEGATAWLQRGDPSRWELMHREHLDEFADAVEAVTMGRAVERRHVPGGEIAEEPGAGVISAGGARRPVTSPVRRR